MWEGNERTFQRLQLKIIDLLMEEGGFDQCIAWRESGPDLRVKARGKLKRDEDGLLEEPIVLKFEVR